MNGALESYQRNDFTIKIYTDMDGSVSNPRDNCNNGLFLGFPHRNYKIGDEQVDPNNWTLHCPTCQGTGLLRFPIMGEEVEVDCTKCPFGQGELPVESFEDACTYARENYNIVGPILPVSLYDHGNVSYQVGRPTDPWDSGDAGIIFATRELLDEAQGENVTPSDEDLTKWLTGEIEEYSRWANGEVYGYVITDPNGDEVDSCWGFIGYEWVKEAAEEACPDADEIPPALHALRFTDRTLDVIEKALSLIGAADPMNREDYERALEIVLGARQGGDPEGQNQYASPVTLEAHVPLLAAGRKATFNLNPASRKKYREQGWW